MEFDFSVFEKQKQYNEILRAKYEALVEEEKGIVGGSGRRITLKKMGQQVGVSESMISRWLKGDRELNSEAIVKMADVLLNEKALLEMKKEYRVK